MRPASAYRSVLATLGFFTVAAGDVFRYALSWWGWAAIVLVVVALMIVELVRERAGLHRLPLTLLSFVAFATASIAWSAYPAETALGVAALVLTTLFAAYLAVVLDLEQILDAARRAFAWVLALSLAFELFVSIVIRDRILPLWVDYSGLDHIPNAYFWSRNLLFEGGRIQGIVGNANLLGMVALLCLILFAARAVQHPATRSGSIAGVVLAVVVIALTRSSTVLAALGVVAVLLLVVLLARRAQGWRRILVYLVSAAVLTGLVVVVLVFRTELLETLGKSPDLTYRLVIWDTVLGLANERPVAGWGWVGYWPPWQAPFDGLLQFDGVTYYQAHNAWIDVFLQLGGIGLMLFAIYVVVTAVRAVTRVVDAQRTDLPTALAVFALVVALLTQSLTESRLLIELGWALFAVIAIVSAPLSPRRRNP
jgi:exopolysaccharide production protein ExoQ